MTLAEAVEVLNRSGLTARTLTCNPDRVQGGTLLEDYGGILGYKHPFTLGLQDGKWDAAVLLPKEYGGHFELENVDDLEVAVEFILNTYSRVFTLG